MSGAPEGRQRTRVVLADDHAVFREGIERALRRDGGFDVLAVCPDGTQALQAIEAHRPDLALLDIHMPGLTGLEVLARVRASPELAATTVALLSASDDVEWVAEHTGADLGLGKHLARAAILQSLRTVLPATPTFHLDGQVDRAAARWTANARVA